MKRIQQHILPAYSKKRLICVIDNHMAHRGPAKEEVLDQFCETHFIPTYSCELNGPIETAWAIVKKRVIPKFTQLQLKKTSTREKCIEVLKKELQKIEPSTFANLQRSHYCYLT
jgi:transposase